MLSIFYHLNVVIFLGYVGKINMYTFLLTYLKELLNRYFNLAVKIGLLFHCALNK